MESWHTDLHRLLHGNMCLLYPKHDLFVSFGYCNTGVTLMTPAFRIAINVIAPTFHSCDPPTLPSAETLRKRCEVSR
jgi:hypothetical protein